MIQYTASGGGYYRVYRDGIEVSKHTAEREAAERAANLAMTSDGEVEYRHEYAVRVESETVGYATQQDVVDGDQDVLDAVMTDQNALFVATDGDNSSDGSIDFPLRTLGAAKEKVADLIARGLVSDVIVYFRGGTYRVDEVVEFGTSDYDESHSITYKSYPGETAEFNGSVPKSGTWHDEGGGVYSLDIKGTKTFRTLLINGQRAQRARWPAEGDYLIQGELPTFSSQQVYDYIAWDQARGMPNGENGNPAMSPAEVLAGHIEIVNYDDYCVERHKYARADDTKIYLASTSDMGLNYFSHYNRYYFENSRAFVLNEGDWYYNDIPGHADEGKLFYYPTTAQVEDGLKNMDVEVPVVDRLLDIKGDDPSVPVSGDFTVSMWFKTGVNGASDWYKSLIRTTDGTGKHGFGVFLNRSTSDEVHEGFIRVRYCDDNLHTAYATGITGLNDNKWHHVAVSVATPTTAPGTIRVFVDGKENASWLSGNSIPVGAKIPTSPPVIGWNGGRNDYWDGGLDDIIILGRAIKSTDEACVLRDKRYSAYTTPSTNSFVYHLPTGGSFVCDTIEGIETRKCVPYRGHLADSEATLKNGYRSFDGTDDFINHDHMPGKRVKNLSFVGLAATGFDWPDVGTTGFTRASGYVDSGLPQVKGVFNLKYAKNITIADCNIYEVGGTAVKGGVCENISVLRNEMHDIGCTGIHFEGIKNLSKVMITEGHHFDGNTICDIGDVERNGSGIACYSISRSTANHNTICNAARFAISFNTEYNSFDRGRSDIEVGYNRIRNCLTEVQHNGAMRINGYNPNSRWHHNYVSDIVTTPNHNFRRLAENGNFPGPKGWHCDQGSGGCTFDHNLLVNCEGEAISWNGAMDMTVVNNIIVTGGQPSDVAFRQRLGKNGYVGPDGSTVDYWASMGCVVRSNVFYSATAGQTCWRPEYYEPSRSGALAAWTNDQDSNCFYAGGSDEVIGQRNPGQPPSTTQGHTLAWARSEWTTEKHSINEDPDFRMDDADDFYVQNSNVLALGFENFQVPK